MALSSYFDDQLFVSHDTNESTASNWDALYCSHLWSDSNLRREVIKAYTENKVIKYCYTCKGKIRKYEIRSPKQDFVPNNHSTPNPKITTKDERPTGQQTNVSIHPTDTLSNNVESGPTIPTISRQIDSSIRQKFTTYEMRPRNMNRRKIKKSLKGIGCVVNLALIDSPIKKRTQIQACSISVMIIAIVVISFILVNFTTTSFTSTKHVVSSTIVVPTMNSNETSSIINKIKTIQTVNFNHTEQMTVTEAFFDYKSNNVSKDAKYSEDSEERKTNELNITLDASPETSTNLPPDFCSCQTNEICMLETTSGKGICRKPLDKDDPTGCGGLCALNIEACREIDKRTGVKYCMSLLGPTASCSDDEWQCRNLRCVPAEARCDGTPNCYDKSDEMNCECDLSKNFRCGHSMSCLPNAKRCDRVVDCWDGFDEINCTAVCPNEDQFTCNTGQCIELALFCDGLADCADGSDEPQGCRGPCRSHEMHCANGRCVSTTRRCDRQDDCGDMSDEIFCTDNRPNVK